MRDTGLGLPPDHPTLPSLLKAAGYNAALIGKCGAGLHALPPQVRHQVTALMDWLPTLLAAARMAPHAD